VGNIHWFGKRRRSAGLFRRDPLARWLASFTLAAAALGVYSYAGEGTGSSSLPVVHSYGGGNSSTTVRRSVESGSGECNIKGNISVDTGERIFHVPGQRYYGETRINPLYGERWFCSEAEARAAGWRKAKI
jgi:hypothetical protein